MTNSDDLDALSVRLRYATAKLHVEAEKTGIISALIRGTAAQADYLYLLRNLYPVYRCLEDHLERHRRSPAIAPFARRELYRADRIEADLVGLIGAGWPELFPLLPSTKAYVAAIARDGEARGDALLGHAYVRYLGDLSGGQTMYRILSRSLCIAHEHLSFLVFPQIIELNSYRAGFRLALDQAQSVVDPARVVEAAVNAFSYNIAMSKEIGRPADAA